MILLIGPRHEFPVEDDWDYSKTVWNLLRTGELHRLEVTQATVFFPALWGALFSTLFGFSFTTLRISTLVLAVGVLMFFYALLGELEFDVARRLLGTLSLMIAPPFVYLAFSFMTDIPLLFGVLGALWLYARGWRQGDLRLILAGSGWATLGFLARQVGGLVPLASMLFVAWQGKRRAWSLAATVKWVAAGALVPLAAMAGYLIWTHLFGGANWADQSRTLRGTFAFWLQFNTPGVLARRYVIAAATIGIYVLPLWLATAPAARGARRGWSGLARLRRAMIVILVCGFVVALARLALRGEWFPYLTDILTRRGLRPYLGFFAYELGVQRPLIFMTAASEILTVVAGAMGLLLSTLIVTRLGSRLTPELALVYGTTLVTAAVSLTFFTYFERYLLPLIPGAIILLLDATRRARFLLRAGLTGFLIVATFSIALMRDYFAWNQVRWDAGRALLASGVPVEKIDGGYEWNGWYLYDASMAYIITHPVRMTIDPWKYILDPEFLFAFGEVADYDIAQELSFATPLRDGGKDRMFLLQRGK